jgi:propanediol dehydratase small subunit
VKVSQEELISSIVREVLAELNGGKAPAKTNGATAAPAAPAQPASSLDPARDFPLGTKRPDLVKTSTGKRLEEITLEGVMKGETTADELRITAETLELQAQIAEKVGRSQLARNMRRAGELTRIPDERVLQIYNAMRPYRSTKADLLAIADELDSKYGARVNAAFVREAANVYERRGRLKED